MSPPQGFAGCQEEFSAPLMCPVLLETQPDNDISAKQQHKSLQVYHILPTSQATSGLSD